MLTRKFHRFLKKNKGRHEPWKNKGRRSGPSKQGEVICYECKKPGHIKVDCPTLKKDRLNKDVKDESRRKYKGNGNKKQRAFWANSETESSDEEEVEETVNLCLMAKDEESEDEEDYVSTLNHSELKLHVHDLLEGFEGFKAKFKSLKKECNALKLSNQDRSLFLLTSSSTVGSGNRKSVLLEFFLNIFATTSFLNE